MYAIENSNYCNLKYAIQFLLTCFFTAFEIDVSLGYSFWKIRKILEI